MSGSASQGADKTRYTVIPRTLVFVRAGDRLLLLKGAPHKRLWAGLFNGIGGHLERGEDPLSAARRELQEETGLSGLPLQLAAVITIDTGAETPGINLFVFLADLPPTPLPELHASPEGAPEWVPLAALPDLPLVEDLPVLLPRLLNRSPAEPPLCASYRYTPTGKLQIQFAN